MLSSLSEVGSVGEILHYHNANGRTPGEAWSLRCHLTVMPTLCDLERVVLKIHLSHLEKHDSSVADLLKWLPKAQLILQYRENTLEQYVSQVRASESRVFARSVENADSSSYKVKIDPYRFVDYGSKMVERFQRAMLELNGRPYLLVSYEQSLAAPQDMFGGDICAFLGVQAGPVHSNTLLQREGSLEEAVSNPEVLRKCTLEPSIRQVLERMRGT